MSLAPRPVFFSRVTVALCGALGALLMSALGLFVALQFPSQRFPHFSAWQMARFLASITTEVQAVEIFAWAAITGIFIALGIGASSGSRARAAAAAVAGALVPIGFVWLAHLLSRVWPDTTGPGDAPGMALLLALYSLGIPWLLGRLIRSWVPSYGVAIHKQATISQ